MRALRSRSVKSDSGNNISDTEKIAKKVRRNKKTKRNSKKKSDTSDVSTDLLTKSLESTETRLNEESIDVAKSRRASRYSKKISKENISPNIKERPKQNDEPKKRKKKSRRNERHTSEEPLEFENVVTSTMKKPKKNKKSKIRDSSDEQPRNKVQSSRKTRSQNFDVEDINVSKKSVNKTRSSLNKTRSSLNKTRNSLNNTESINNTKSINKTRSSATFEKTSDSLLFENIVTSTTIKPKKRKQSTKEKSKTSKNLMDDVNDKKSSNILLNNDIIIISDGVNTNKNDQNTENVTDVLNSTYSKIDEHTSIVSTNNSGSWNTEQKSIINISDETKMFESNSNKEIFTSPTDTNKDPKKVFFQDESLSKSVRKKWQRFPRNSQGANSILEQISTPQKSQKKSLPNKSLNISQKLNKTGNTTLGTSQSANKIKRTAMPNFALIHQKAYAKMESISEYSQRKKDRANLLLSNKKVPLKENEPENKIKSSRQLFSEKSDTSKLKFNRFGFKLKPNPIIKTVEKPQNTLKPAISEREEILAIANKKAHTGKLRENKRDLLKGVRTNRRFELLMKMRNN